MIRCIPPRGGINPNGLIVETAPVAHGSSGGPVSFSNSSVSMIAPSTDNSAADGFGPERIRQGCWRFLILLGFLALAFPSAVRSEEPRKPTLFLVGDSTVKNYTPGQVGWGTPLPSHFDGSRITVQNRALGGRSSRSYLREGLWQKVLGAIKPGDFVMIQFGHNDNGPLAEGKARASLKGNGDESQEVTLAETQKSEVVRSYGWDLRRYIAETKQKGATPIVCSPVARNLWENGQVIRARDTYSQWAREAAVQGGALFIDLNEVVSQRYEALGSDKVQALFTSSDHTHTNRAGAELNAACVVDSLRRLDGCYLATYLAPNQRP